MQNCFLMPSRLKSNIILVLDRLQCVARVNCLVYLMHYVLCVGLQETLAKRLSVDPLKTKRKKTATLLLFMLSYMKKMCISNTNPANIVLFTNTIDNHVTACKFMPDSLLTYYKVRYLSVSRVYA